jgi:uncharacterized surface protein with fasciclin (FAS1) repeats
MQTYLHLTKPFSVFFLFLKFFIMKKFCLSTSMVASFILFVSFGFAQQKMAVAKAKNEVTTAAQPTKVAITNSQPTKATQTQSGTVADIVGTSKDHSTLLVALKSAGLVETLKGAGPFTVFAPTNDAFSKVPAAALDNLLKPESKDALTKVLGNHVVAGNLKAEDIISAIKVGGGTATYNTISGDKLTATLDGEKVKLTDSGGIIAFVTTANLTADNGVVHVIDTVLSGK